MHLDMVRVGLGPSNGRFFTEDRTVTVSTARGEGHKLHLTQDCPSRSSTVSQSTTPHACILPTASPRLCSMQQQREQLNHGPDPIHTPILVSRETHCAATMKLRVREVEARGTASGRPYNAFVHGCRSPFHVKHPLTTAVNDSYPIRLKAPLGCGSSPDKADLM